MSLQDFCHSGLVDLGGLDGRGRAFPQRQEVLGRQVVGQLQQHWNPFSLEGAESILPAFVELGIADEGFTERRPSA
jgi:hypothetical protein